MATTFGIDPKKKKPASAPGAPSAGDYSFSGVNPAARGINLAQTNIPTVGVNIGAGGGAGGIAGGPRPLSVANPEDPQYFIDIAKMDAYFNARNADFGASQKDLSRQYSEGQADLHASSKDAARQYGEGQAEFAASEKDVSRNLADAMAQLGLRQPEDILQNQRAANKAGLLVSSEKARTEGLINKDYELQRTSVKGDAESQKGAIGRGLSALSGNYASQKDAIARGLTSLSGNYASQSDEVKRRIAELTGAYGPGGYERNQIFEDTRQRALEKDRLFNVTTNVKQADPLASTIEAMTGSQSGTRSTPTAGYQYVQDTGTRAGLSYKVVQKNGKSYRYYENGDVVLR